jgi:hypothetical protein
VKQQNDHFDYRRARIEKLAFRGLDIVHTDDHDEIAMAASQIVVAPGTSFNTSAEQFLRERRARPVDGPLLVPQGCASRVVRRIPGGLSERLGTWISARRSRDSGADLAPLVADDRPRALQLDGIRDPIAICRELRGRDTAARVSPNYIAFGFHHRTGWPADDPTPATRPPSPAPGEAGVRVAVIDTGWADAAQDWFGGTIDYRVGGAAQLDELDRDTDSELDTAAGHGVFVASIIRRRAPDCHITFVKALDSYGIGTSAQVADAIRLAMDTTPDIINLSLGFYPTTEFRPVDVEAAIEFAFARAAQEGRKLVIVAAAGNHPLDTPTWPAALPGVYGVGAIEEARVRTSWSAYGSWLQAWARGEDIHGVYVNGLGGGYQFKGGARWSGTSFAAPVVAGAIAAAKSAGREDWDQLAPLATGWLDDHGTTPIRADVQATELPETAIPIID